ncbi:MAG: peroxiredoxin [Thermoanaerobaculales bacterium]|jgi:peroxiredoxin (alkyl hydroperoxide reductase subunit C)|nr:peroxiredoxin [Thermoanaerobaculales bacterium]
MLVTRPAPDFTATAVLGDDTFDEEFSLASLRGRYVVLLFYPLDFTFVCPTEILAFNEVLDEFHARDAEVVGVSVDSHYSHLAWKRTPVDDGGIGEIRFPLVSDLTKEISRSYDVLLEDGVALRGLFLIDREGTVRHAVINDLPLGRNVAEALRMLDALRHHELHGTLCPANWSDGKASMDPTRDGVVDYLSRFAR